MAESVILSRSGVVARLTLNIPERHNSLGEAELKLLRGHVARVDADPDCRALIVTGAGDQAFCSGGDLKERKGMSDALSAFDRDALTWEWPLLSGAYRMTDRYDHLLISPELICVDARATYVGWASAGIVGRF